MGQFNHTIDSKNRLFLPARFREELGDSFVITAGLDGCLYICPRADFEEFAKKDYSDCIEHNDNMHYLMSKNY